MSADLVFRGERRPAAAWRERAAKAAFGLRAAGLCDGAKIGILLPNGFDFMEAYKAAGMACAIPVPISTELSKSDYDAISRREPLNAFITTAALAKRWRKQAAGCLFLVGEPTPHANSWELLIAQAAGSTVAGMAPGQMFFTSGTSTTPKTVLRAALPMDVTHRRTRRFERSWGMEPGMRALVTGPLYHQAPLLHAMSALECAQEVVLLDAFDPESVLAAIAEHRITHLHLVPRLMNRLAALPNDVRSRYDVSSLKFALHGAAKCPIAVKRELIDWWKPIFREYYATSEFGMVCEIDSPAWLERPSSVGLPFEGVEIEIRDADSGERLANQAIGRVFMRSDDMPDFHYREPDGVSAIISRGDWVTVNDFGYCDEDGYLHLTGRDDDMAVISGVNVSLHESLIALLRLVYVDDALVEIAPDQERGDVLRAYIRLKRGVRDVSAAKIRADLRDKVRPIAIPRSMIFVKKKLPVLDSGKTIRRYLDLDGALRDEVEYPPAPRITLRQARPPTFPAGVDAISKELTGSTNDDAVAHARVAGAPCTVIWAERQSRGRGRGGRTWISQPGNVYWTMLVDTSGDTHYATGLVFVTALAVLSTVRALAPGDRRVEIKWPNDILIEGRKVSGILIDSAVGRKGQMRAVGVGINVVTYPHEGLIYQATSLRAEGSAAHRNEAITLLTSSFLGYLELWRNAGFAPLREEYLPHAYRRGKNVSVRLGPNDVVSGIFTDISETGIVLTLSNGSNKTIGAGELLSGGN